MVQETSTSVSLQRTGVNIVDVLFVHANTSEEIPQKYSNIEGSLRKLHNKTKTIINITFHLIDQSSLQEIAFFVRGLHRYRRWDLCIGVVRVIATKCERVLWHIAIPGRLKYYWHARKLDFGRVGRVVVNWAHLSANEDYYERRI